jgi:hypothetical protein
VLATGPVNPPAVWFLAGGSVWFGSKPGQNPDPHCVGGVVTWTADLLGGFARVVHGQLFYFYGSCNILSN